MTRMHALSSDQVIKALKRAGFDYAPRRGRRGHVALCRAGEGVRPLLVIVPKRSVLPVGTLLSILWQAKMPKEKLVLLPDEAAPLP